MIRALVSGELIADPQSRQSRNGNTFATCRIAVKQQDGDRLFCSCIVFDDNAVTRLLQLRAGAAVSMAGTLKIGTWQARDGSVKPSLDIVADEIAATTPRPKKPKPERPQRAQPAYDDSVDWLSA